MERYLTQSEQQRILNAAKRDNTDKSQRDYHMMGALLHSGMRINEFRLMTRCDVEQALITGYLFIPRENRKGGNKDHSVYLTQPLRLHLESLLRISENPDPSSPLIYGRDGGSPMTVRNYQQRVRYWAEQASIHLPVSPHWFRHARAMNILRGSQANDPMGIVQRSLGHSNRSTTAIYAGPTREDVEAALNRVDGKAGRKPSLTSMRRQYEEHAL